MADRQWQYFQSEQFSKEVGLTRLMLSARRRVKSGRGPYDVTVDGEPVLTGASRRKVLQRLKHLAQVNDVGQVVRVRDPKGHVPFRFREVKPAFQIINTNGNQKIDKVWSAVKSQFSSIRFLGAYVCKHIFGSYTMSQHSYGNAVDIGDATMHDLWQIAYWVVAHAQELEVEHVIVANRIWTRGVGWHYYDGEYHYHVHVDCFPNYSGPCGVRG